MKPALVLTVSHAGGWTTLQNLPMPNLEYLCGVPITNPTEMGQM